MTGLCTPLLHLRPLSKIKKVIAIMSVSTSLPCLATSERHTAELACATGAVTFLFTDIVGSTALWEQDGSRMSQALAAHDALARNAVESRRGRLVKTTGDGIHAAFDDALDALAATLDLQQALDDPAATSGVALRVRCGLHKGFGERRDDDYFGSSVNRAARIMNTAHGGQVLLSQAVADDIADKLPASVVLRDLGKIRLKDFAQSEHVFEVMHPRRRQESSGPQPREAKRNEPAHEATISFGRVTELAELRRLLAEVRTVALGRGSKSARRARGETCADHGEDTRLVLLLDTCEDVLDSWPNWWTGPGIGNVGSGRRWRSTKWVWGTPRVASSAAA